MEYSKAIEILRRHNEWRRGAEIPMEEPQVIGDAIDTVVENGCKEQPEVDLEEESYMRGFAQGAKEERERMREDIIKMRDTAEKRGLNFGAECGFQIALDELGQILTGKLARKEESK